MTEVKDKDQRSDKSPMEKPFNIEERMGRVEGALGQMGERLNHVETAIVDLRNHVDTELSGMRGEMDERFRSTNRTMMMMYRIMITMWVTIIIAILSGILTMIFKM
jgi:hypothetical protein